MTAEPPVEYIEAELDTCVAAVQSVIDDLTEADVLTVEDRVRVLCWLRDARAEFDAIAKQVERELLTEAGERRFVVDGLGEVEIHRKTKRTGWRHDELIGAVVARVMDERETLYDPTSGELLPYTQIGTNVAARLRECISFGAGKVTGLRAIGLQPDEFCAETPDGYGVQLPVRQVDTPKGEAA